jgi:hypothetical protein
MSQPRHGQRNQYRPLRAIQFDVHQVLTSSDTRLLDSRFACAETSGLHHPSIMLKRTELENKMSVKHDESNVGALVSHENRLLKSAEALVRKRGLNAEPAMSESSTRAAEASLSQQKKWRAKSPSWERMAGGPQSSYFMTSDAEQVLRMAPVPALPVRKKQSCCLFQSYAASSCSSAMRIHELRSRPSYCLQALRASADSGQAD